MKIMLIVGTSILSKDISKLYNDGIIRTIDYYKANHDLTTIDKKWNNEIDLLIIRYFKSFYPDGLNNKENFGLSSLNIKVRLKYIKCQCIFVK